MASGFCYSSGVGGTSCTCTNILGEQGDCLIDLNDKQIYNLFWSEVGIALVLHSSLWIACIYLLAKSLKGVQTLKEAFKRNIYRGTLVKLIIAEFFRILYYAVDPHSINGIWGNVGESLINFFPILLWITSFDVLILAYLAAVSKVRSLQPLESQFQGVRILLFVVIGFCVVVLVPALIAAAITESAIAWGCYQIGLVLAVFTCLGVTIVYGIRIKRLLRETETKSAGFGAYLQRSTNILGGITVVFAILILTMFALVFTRATPTSTLILQIILRFEEFASLGFMIALLANRIQTYKQNSSGPSNSHTTTKEHSVKVSAKVDGTHAAINEQEMHGKTTSDTSTDFSSNGVLSAGLPNTQTATLSSATDTQVTTITTSTSNTTVISDHDQHQLQSEQKEIETV